MYVIEIALKLSPLPLIVQRKDFHQAELVYKTIREAMGKGKAELLDLTCEKVEDKKITVLASEILAVQMYEKTAAIGGIKRPGFSFEE